MSAETGIAWCDSTFNPWIGCTKVSVGAQGACVNCYAEVATPARAMKIAWGAGQPRHRTSESTWKQPLTWERQHEAFFAVHGRRRRVFCASLADVFDNEVDPRWRADLFRMIHDTPHLDWLLLTKRIGNAREMIDDARNDAHLRTSSSVPWPWPNVWLGSTIANQPEADRDIERLLAVPVRVHFLSMEPLLGLVDITPHLWGRAKPCDGCPRDADCNCGMRTRAANCESALDWVIVGGESGGGARSMEIGWVSRIVEQCADAGVACFVKQLGARPLMAGVPWKTEDRKGGDPAEWPVSLNVREFPR